MINTHLVDFSAELENDLTSLFSNAKPASLYQPVHYTLELKAKRIRPLLALLGAGIINEKPMAAKSAALAVEMLHNFTLIHDDIMDNADTRRGKPSVFKKWNVSTAILSGDVLFAKSYAKLRELEVPADVLLTIFDEFNNAVVTVCEGQALDMEFESRDVVDIAEYEYMIYCKTAALLKSSLVMGGMVAGASAEELGYLDIIGRKLGIAFQMQDDLLDAVGDVEKFGKIKGGDIIAGKKTFLMIGLLSNVPDLKRSEVLEIVSKASTNNEYVSEIIELMYNYKVIEETEQKVEYLYNMCFDSLSKLPQNAYSEALFSIIEKLKNRDH